MFNKHALVSTPKHHLVIYHSQPVTTNRQEHPSNLHRYRLPRNVHLDARRLRLLLPCDRCVRCCTSTCVKSNASLADGLRLSWGKRGVLGIQREAQGVILGSRIMRYISSGSSPSMSFLRNTTWPTGHRKNGSGV
jgi:hypothetical protein